MFAGPIGPFGPVPEIGLDCVELVSLTSRLVSGDSIKSLVSTIPYLTNALGDLSFHFLNCVVVSLAFPPHLKGHNADAFHTKSYCTMKRHLGN